MKFETEAEYLAWRDNELPLPPYRDEDEFFVAKPKDCEMCHGTGDIVHLLDRVEYYGDEVWEQCPECEGTGTLDASLHF